MILAVGATLLAIRVGDDDVSSVFSGYAEAAKRAGTYRFSTTQKITGSQPDLGSSFNMQGVVDLERKLSRITMNITVLGGKTTCTYISDGESVYINVHPSRRAQLGATWLKTSATSPLSGVSLPFRPDQFDDEPEKVFEDLEETGTATVRDVETTRYSGTFDLQPLVPQASAAPLGTRFAEGLPVEVFIDADGLMRRIDIDLSRSGPVSVLMRMELFDYGKPVDIKEPPAAQTKQGTATNAPTACFPLTFGADT